MMLIHRRLGFARLLILPLVLILCLYFLVPTFPVHAATFTVTNVNDAGTGSLRNAITQANTTPGIDEITFATSGTITLASSLPNISDDLVINGLGQTITINGNNVAQPFTINNGVILTLIALTVRNGNAAQGGAILNNGGDVSIYNVTLELNNSTGEGGAIYTGGGTLNVLRSTLVGNSSVGSGSAIYNNGSNVIITGSTIDGHLAGDSPVYSTGGGLDILASTFSGNTSGAAGALQFDNGTLNVSNSTFSNNTGTTSGVLLVNGGTVTIQNATFGDNTGGTAGGIVSIAGTLTVQNTILDNTVPNCSGVALTGNNNLERAAVSTCATATLVDPLTLILQPLGSNGGPTQTRALTIGGTNPALNAGDNTICAAPPVNNHDQRCFGPRPTPCSIGAYEPEAVSAMQSGELELAFGAAEIVPGGSSTLTFTFSNGNNFAWLNQIGFINSLPVGLSFVPGAIPPGCTQLPIVSGSTFFIAGLSLQPGESCAITVNVTATAGTYTTTADTAFAAETGITITNDSLTVRAQTSGGNTGSVQVSTIPETVTRLPSTGYPPQQPNTDWQLMVLGIASLLLVSGVTLLLSKLHKY